MATKSNALLYAQDAIQKRGVKAIVYRVGPHWMYHTYTTETIPQLITKINQGRKIPIRDIEDLNPKERN